MNPTPKRQSGKRMKIRRLNRYEKALLCLAYHINRNPMTDYDVEKEVLDILELEPLPAKDKQKGV